MGVFAASAALDASSRAARGRCDMVRSGYLVSGALMAPLFRPSTAPSGSPERHPCPRIGSGGGRFLPRSGLSREICSA